MKLITLRIFKKLNQPIFGILYYYGIVIFMLKCELKLREGGGG